MRRPMMLSAAAAAAATIGFIASPAIAQQQPQGGVNPVVVSGVVSCSHAGPVGRQAVTWTVDNATGFSLNLDGNGTESGMIGTTTIGPVGLEVTPNPIPVASSGTAGDGPFEGTGTGTLSFIVSWNFQGGGEFPTEGESTGTVTVPGGCVNVDPSTSTSSTSTTSTIRTTTTVAAAVVTTPRFTG